MEKGYRYIWYNVFARYWETVPASECLDITLGDAPANRTEFAHISESADVNFGLISIHTFCFIHFGLAFIRSYSHSNGD